ncbi:MAG: hypothetical protein WC614_08065 [bacterium]
MKATINEKEISNLIHELPAPLIHKLVEFLEVLRPELKTTNKKKNYELFAKAMGSWKDIDTEKIYNNLNKEWKKWKLSV